MQKTGTKPTPTAAIERHLTVPELSKLLNLDPRAVRRMFPDEPTAARMRTALQPGRRSHSTLHIPASTALRILRRLTGVGDDGAILAGGNSLPSVPAMEVAA
jgi:hypothetical protein